jgi:hypothetical protein
MTPSERLAAKAAYQMPPAVLGPCLWRDSPHSDPVPGVITSIGSRSCQVTVFVPENRGTCPMDGVRHITDPEINDHPDYTGGCWDYTDEQKRLQFLVVAVEDALKQIGDLDKELQDLKAVVAN